MEILLSILEEKAQEECIDEQKLRYIAFKIVIWDHFGIPQAHYLRLDTNEKSKMLNECYKKLVPVYFRDGKNDLFFSVWILDLILFLSEICIFGQFLDVWKFCWHVSVNKCQQQLPGFCLRFAFLACFWMFENFVGAFQVIRASSSCPAL